MGKRRNYPGREQRITERIRLLRGALAANPKLAERTRQLLAHEIPAPTLEDATMDNEEQIALRLPADALERAEALVPKLAKLPALAAVRVTRSAVLRMAILRGLDALEAETERARPPRRRR